MLEGHVIDGRYQLVRLVGAGGMSEVWEALHLGLGRPVALKRLSPHLAGRPVELRVGGEPASSLAIEYDWLAALPDVIKKIIAVASAIPTAIGALLAYGKEMSAFARRLLGRE